jgi:hypothetical protein
VTPLKSKADFSSPFSSFKGKIQQKIFQWQNFSGVNDTAETDFGDCRSDFLGEYDAICKTVLAC